MRVAVRVMVGLKEKVRVDDAVAVTVPSVCEPVGERGFWVGDMDHEAERSSEKEKEADSVMESRGTVKVCEADSLDETPYVPEGDNVMEGLSGASSESVSRCVGESVSEK